MEPADQIRSDSYSWKLLTSCVLLLMLVAPAGCALFAPPQISISGHIYGTPYLTSPTQGLARVPQPLPATVRCNKSQATAAKTGIYALRVDQASQYACTITATDYLPITVTLTGKAGSNLTLNLGAVGATDPLPCSGQIAATSITCAELQLRPAKLVGSVTSADTLQPLASAVVTCWQPGTGSTPPLETSSTGPTGAFTVSSAPAGTYACRAGTDPTLYTGSVEPGGTAELAMRVCSLHCPAVTYHNGAVMHDLTAYLVFWLPKGATFEPSGSSPRFESLIAQYINDVGGTPLYGLVTQYWDYAGNVDNTVSLGAAYTDTTPYPHAGSRADPISSDNIEREIDRDTAANHWTVDGEHAIFLFTGFDVESCIYSSSGKQCSFGSARHFCAYHSDFHSANGLGDVIYGYIPVLSDCSRLQELTLYGSPNHDSIADATLNSLSHEQFESVTDPYGQGWYDHDPDEGEIADKCEYVFGAIRADGSNVTLGHGHAYLLQEEWSDRINGCASQ